ARMAGLDEVIAKRVSRQAEEQPRRPGAFERFDRGNKSWHQAQGPEREAGRFQKTAAIQSTGHGRSKHDPPTKETKFSAVRSSGCDWKWVRGCRLKPAFRPQWNAGFSRPQWNAGFSRPQWNAGF